MYNGTFREALKCHNCGEEGHKLYNCPKKEKPTWTPFSLACVFCGAITHAAVDCPLKSGDPRARSLHKEYDQFMSEIDTEVPGGNPEMPMGGGGRSRAGLGFVPGGGAASSGAAIPLRFPHLHPLDIRNSPNWTPGPSDSSASSFGARPQRAQGMTRPPMPGMNALPPMPAGGIPAMNRPMALPPCPPAPSPLPFFRPQPARASPSGESMNYMNDPSQQSPNFYQSQSYPPSSSFDVRGSYPPLPPLYSSSQQTYEFERQQYPPSSDFQQQSQPAQFSSQQSQSTQFNSQQPYQIYQQPQESHYQQIPQTNSQQPEHQSEPQPQQFEYYS